MGDGYVELKRAYYSVPPEYVGRKVWGALGVPVAAGDQPAPGRFAVHALAEPGITTDPNHLHSPYRRVVQQSLDHLLDRARLIAYAYWRSWAE